MSHRTYIERFDDGSGGWFGWISNAAGAKRLEVKDSVAISRSPWWIDYNHAPPGGGYLQLAFCLLTKHYPSTSPQLFEVGGRNNFVEGDFPTDFTNARVTLRLKGEVELRGAQMLFLAQAMVGTMRINHVLTTQPIKITPDWSEQTITLVPDPMQWKCMGSRHDRQDFYGWGDIRDVLADLNLDIIFVLHPIDVAPLPPIQGDIHRLRTGEDYTVDPTRLPSGYVMLDEVGIEFRGA